MKVGILISSINNFGAKGLYNSQEIGMARALKDEGHEVEIYKFVSSKIESIVREECVESNINIKYIPAKSLGTHGINNLKNLSRDLSYLIYFSDIQILLSKVYKWCKKNHIELIPYVGVIESNSTSKKTKLLTNFIALRNLKIYKKCNKIVVKTPYVKEKMRDRGIENIIVFPVGLDKKLLNSNYNTVDRIELRKKYNCNENDKVILFVGRLDFEKRPDLAIELLNDAVKEINNCRLIMVGKGCLQEKVYELVEKYKLQEKFIYIESILNKDIWELYHISDYFINLNENEIFGMAILEAMYYKCCVIALEAPGPNFIIEDKINGYLINSPNDFIKIIRDNVDDRILNFAYKRVNKCFMWNNIKTFLN